MNESYAKIFPSMYTGSMYGAGAVVFAVWCWILSHKDENGEAEVNPVVVGNEIGCTPQEVEAALGYLMRPDPNSRSKDHEGQRLIRLSQFSYRVVNNDKYRRQGRDRTTYWRQYREKKRATGCATGAQVAQPKSTQAEAEAEAEKNTPLTPRGGNGLCGPESTGAAKGQGAARPKKLAARRQPFVPPTVEEVRAYATSKGYPDFDAQKFVDYYEAANWHDAKGDPVRNWKQKFLAVWAKNQPQTPGRREPKRGDPDWDPTAEEAAELLRASRTEGEP
jgi:hypothetical protein